MKKFSLTKTTFHENFKIIILGKVMAAIPRENLNEFIESNFRNWRKN
jgi:hypothetical protein